MSKVKAKLNVPSNVKCNCGHTKKDHYNGGWCHSSGHPKAGQCGCTFYAPNDRWILNNSPERKMLKKLAEGLKTLKEEEFYYKTYISESKDDCGTVCCAIGWAPRFIPESKVNWKNAKGLTHGDWLQLFYENELIDPELLTKIFKLNFIAIEYMFYGGDLKITTYNALNLTLPQVIERIEYIHKHYRKYRL